MNFSLNKAPIKIIKEGGTYFLETFILVLMKSGTKFMKRICSVKKY